MSKVRGLVQAADTAGHWAGLAEARAGGRGQRVLDRLANLLSKDDLEALESLVAASTARAFERHLRHEADIEETDPEALTLHECAACGATVPIQWTPPEG